ncbi:MAG: GTP cyclohydrolase FolE2 [Puniceicoccales bacterium]
MSSSDTSSAGTAPQSLTGFDPSFQPAQEYEQSLPDTQNLRATEIQGASVPIQEVGSSNFRLPLQFRTDDGNVITLEASIFGGVSLRADRKGINMSRIIRVFYEHRDEVVDFAMIHRILEDYQSRLDTDSARLRIAFSMPTLQPSLRSGLAGYQYYDVVLEGRLNANGDFTRMLQIGFVYSSACPCSSDLSEHARNSRGVFAIPHSQRSRARVRVVPNTDDAITPEGLVKLCQKALSTETQAMVRRLDEQAFAELNGTYQKFVEDAARLLYASLDEAPSISAFAVSCSHLESLHSHDAVATIAKGLPTDLSGGMDNYGELIC